jgi:class 3 adenylate cyclase
MQSQDTHNGMERRRLLAVLAADIVAYTKLMEEDEDNTFSRLKDLNSSIIAPTAARNHGSIVKWTGDGFIGIFDSAVDAVRAAIEIQSGIAAVGAGAAQDRQMRLRIGISAGDVIVVPGNVFGDTVNAAARLQTLAAPGNICISRAIKDAVRNKFTIEYEDRGDVELKNMAEPIGAFRVVFDPIAWSMNQGTSVAKPSRFRPYALGAALLVALAATGAVWFVPSHRGNDAVATPLRDAKSDANAPAAAEATPPAPPPAPATEQVVTVAPPPVAPAAASGLTASLLSALPALGDAESKQVANAYETAAGHKAQTVSLQPPGLWRSAKRPTAEDAANSALENCQVYYGGPCILLATDDTISSEPPGGKWPVHDMPRVHYNGDFDPSQIPGIEPDTRKRADIVAYRSVSGPKAAALHPNGGRFFTTSREASQRAAEEAVLRNCNNDPERRGKDGPCYLYAVGNEIVLSRRATVPMTSTGR